MCLSGSVPHAGRRVCEAMERMKQDLRVLEANVEPPKPAKRAKRSSPERHRWLDQWLVAKGEPLRQLVRSTIRLVEHREPIHFPRHRARKPNDLAKHHRAIEGIVCNLAYAVLDQPTSGRLAVNVRHGDKGRVRYDSPAFGKRFSDLVYTLWQEDFLDYMHSRGRGEVSSVAPSAWFEAQIRQLGVSFPDFGRDPAEEMILLSRNLRGNAGWSDEADARKRKERIDFEDDETTRRYRAAVRRLNDFLAKADIAFLDDGNKPVMDPFARTLTRRFLLLEGQDKPRFDQNGRLFGGFWMSLEKNRRSQLRINGEAVANLDYSSMFTRLAYAELGERPPPFDDLYAVPGLGDYRSGVKLAMNCFLFDTHSRRTKWPKKMGVGVGTDADRDTVGSTVNEYEGLLPAGWGVGVTKRAILKLHPALKEAWGRGLGYRLMWRESEVLVAVLEELMRRNIPALGLHDGLLVAASKKDVAQEVMAEQAKIVVGVALQASDKD